MNYSVVFSPKAREQLIALDEYIALAASPEIADRFTDAVTEFCVSLATFPQRGIMRDDLRLGAKRQPPAHLRHIN